MSTDIKGLIRNEFNRRWSGVMTLFRRAAQVVVVLALLAASLHALGIRAMAMVLPTMAAMNYADLGWLAAICAATVYATR